MSRLGAVVVVALGSLGLGCGGDNPSSDPPAEVQSPQSEAPGPTDTPSEGEDTSSEGEVGVALAIDGRAVSMAARAELKVIEGDPAVHVAITGRTSGTDFVMIDLTFDGIADAIGPHHVEFSLPDSGAHIAISSFDDTSYYSQGGQIDVVVDADGSIEGSFDIALAQSAAPQPGEPVVFAPSDVAARLGGSFSGDWVLDCHSRLMGHRTLLPGGDYCDGLVIAE
jgi:hypothetical protein